jgi:hypothetical protein
MHKIETKMSRFPVTVPVDLHRQFKARCAVRGVPMADVVRDLLRRGLATGTEALKAKPAKSAPREPVHT